MPWRNYQLLDLISVEVYRVTKCGRVDNCTTIMADNSTERNSGDSSKNADKPKVALITGITGQVNFLFLLYF